MKLPLEIIDYIFSYTDIITIIKNKTIMSEYASKKLIQDFHKDPEWEQQLKSHLYYNPHDFHFVFDYIINIQRNDLNNDTYIKTPTNKHLNNLIKERKRQLILSTGTIPQSMSQKELCNMLIEYPKSYNIDITNNHYYYNNDNIMINYPLSSDILNDL